MKYCKMFPGVWVEDKSQRSALFVKRLEELESSIFRLKASVRDCVRDTPVVGESIGQKQILEANAIYNRSMMSVANNDDEAELEDEDDEEEEIELDGGDSGEVGEQELEDEDGGDFTYDIDRFRNMNASDESSNSGSTIISPHRNLNFDEDSREMEIEDTSDDLLVGRLDDSS